MQDELIPEVGDKDITVRKVDLGRDICSLVSYAVGCMFGRYSLVVKGIMEHRCTKSNEANLDYIPCVQEYGWGIIF